MVSSHVASRFPFRTGSTRVIGLLVVAFSALSCRGGQQGLPAGSGPDALAGCWALEVAVPDTSAWRPVDRPGVPTRVRLEATPLDSAAVPGSQTAYRAWSLENGEERDHPFHAWRFVRTDSLWVGHPAAYSGHTLRLARGGDTLAGTLATYTDVLGGDVPSPRPARLVRIACPGGAERTEGGS